MLAFMGMTDGNACAGATLEKADASESATIASFLMGFTISFHWGNG